MRHRRTHLPLATLGLLLLLVTTARAADPAGRVAALEGRAEAQAAGASTWAALAPGKDVFVGDRIRTAEASHVKLLMRDDSVITLGAKSELVIDQQVVRAEGERGAETSRFGQLVGSLRAVVTERYGTKGSTFEVKTPTAVGGVRGTGFVSLVDDDGKRTRIIGLYDVTYVRSLADRNGRHEVQVGPRQMTEIVGGGLPTKPRELPAGELGALVATTEMTPGPPGAGGPGGGAQPGGEGGQPGATPEEGSGNPGDPATPGPAGGQTIQQPGTVDQPLNRFRKPQEPPPPPPRG